jgi:hypothetical protein
MLQDSLQRWTAGRPQLRRLTDTETGEQRTARRAVRQASTLCRCVVGVAGKLFREGSKL